MRLRFSKMHGLGNDFMVIDMLTQAVELSPERITQWADRRIGIGFDQLLAVEAPTQPDIDFRYRIYNADGSEAEQCGNGARCFARYVFDRKLTPKRKLLLETSNRQITTHLLDDGQVEVDMGEPEFAPAHIPYRGDDHLEQEISVNGESRKFTMLSVGNPHAVHFTHNVADAPLADWGSALNQHADFPNGVNVGFCQIVDSSFARLRVFERGVGETRACGTGACAAAVAGILTEQLDQKVKVSLPGGKVRIQWQGQGSTVKMTGPAALSFEGTIEV